MNELTDLSICDASDLLNNGSVSSVELTQATLQVIADTEPIVHAYATVLGDAALTAAREADKEISAGKRRSPLHGIPLALKDNIYTKGIRTEGGSQVLAGFIPAFDATSARLLAAAGAVMVGKTICHEFAYGVNRPPTRTPWQLECYPGGSSTGSGVAVTVRSAFGTLGTDTGGSIRIPATVNGIVGLKPTYGRVSSYGVIPLAWSLDHVGPLTRTVKDNAVLLQAIAGYDPLDPYSAKQDVPDFSASIEGGVRGMRLGVERDFFFYEGVTSDVRTAVEAVIAEYAAQGAEIIEVKVPELELTPDTLNTILLAEASSYHQVMLREHGSKYDPATRAALLSGELLPATHYLAAQRARALFRNAMLKLFQEQRLDTLLSPTMPLTTVPLDDLNTLRKDGIPESPIVSIIHHTFSANLSGQPALSVPCGFASNGLPIGFQLLGRPFAEATLFQIARAYEQAHDWIKRKPSVKS
jgi:aspartyl-tRNA(Asn)/glutamyl-tRNA(Gln) amidotransferase subunit A